MQFLHSRPHFLIYDQTEVSLSLRADYGVSAATLIFCGLHLSLGMKNAVRNIVVKGKAPLSLSDFSHYRDVMALRRFRFQPYGLHGERI